MSPMTCAEIAPLLDELHDGTLDDARARAVRAHTRTCETCGRELRQLELFAAAAASLRQPDPPSGQWDLIAARLDREEGSRSRLWYWWHAWRRQVLTGGLVVSLAGAAALVVTLRPHAAPAPVTAPVARVTADELYEAALKEVAKAEDDYTTAIGDLRQIVAVERGRWRPEVAEAFDENLAAIDAAVARQAEVARREPGNPELADALHASYRREIDFLQEAVVRGQTP